MLSLVLFAPIAASTTVSPVDGLGAEQMSVRELMRLDTEHALNVAKNRRHADGGTRADIDGGASYAAGGVLRLVAIYGVGKKLLAQVMVGAQPYVYMYGQALPVGMRVSPSAYMLRGISGSCVQLERKDEAHTLCLHPSSWAEK